MVVVFGKGRKRRWCQWYWNVARSKSWFPQRVVCTKGSRCRQGAGSLWPARAISFYESWKRWFPQESTFFRVAVTSSSRLSDYGEYRTIYRRLHFSFRVNNKNVGLAHLFYSPPKHWSEETRVAPYHWRLRTIHLLSTWRWGCSWERCLISIFSRKT